MLTLLRDLQRNPHTNHRSTAETGDLTSLNQRVKGLLTRIPENPKAVALQDISARRTFSYRKMEKNFHKAQIETQRKDPSSRLPEEIVNNGPSSFKELDFSIDVSSHIGNRRAMEDVHFSIENDTSILAGVFDGHGGNDVALFAKSCFSDWFFNMLEENHYNVRDTFKNIFQQIQSRVEQIPEWNTIGSTAVVCYIDKKTNQIYTATLSDSRADIVRRDPTTNQPYIISLSNIRNWSYPKEIERARRALGKFPEEVASWTRLNPKKIYIPSCAGGVNTSRSLGDFEWRTHREVGVDKDCPPSISYSPKITVYTLSPDDVVIISSDGLETVSRKEIETHCSSPSELVKLALDKTAQARNQDNITVLTIRGRPKEIN